MNKDTAEAILKTMLSVSGVLNDSIFNVMNTEDGDELKKYKRTMGSLMGTILLDVIYPIIEQYPDLTPDHLRSSDEMGEDPETKPQLRWPQLR